MTTEDEIEDAILSVLNEQVEHEAQFPTLVGSKHLVETLTDSLDGADETDILYTVGRFDDSGLVDFSKHSDGHGPVEVRPAAIEEHDKSSQTILSDGRLETVLSTMYEYDKETRGRPISEADLSDQTDIDTDDINAAIWYLYERSYVDATIDNQGWHGPSITERGRSFYERRYQ